MLPSVTDYLNIFPTLSPWNERIAHTLEWVVKESIECSAWREREKTSQGTEMLENSESELWSFKMEMPLKSQGVSNVLQTQWPEKQKMNNCWVKTREKERDWLCLAISHSIFILLRNKRQAKEMWERRRGNLITSKMNLLWYSNWWKERTNWCMSTAILSSYFQRP